MQPLTPSQMVALVLEYIGELDEAHALLDVDVEAEAHYEHLYRKEKAEAWAKVLQQYPDTRTHNVDFKTSQVNALTADRRKERDLAAGRVKGRMEAIRSARQKVSALQTVANAIKEEMGFARVGPER